uniref:Uncharacterized protein n=1 Tax=Opuntia streptacantha TaxID=393608 RepID=A0A7C9DIA5_OPUST
MRPVRNTEDIITNPSYRRIAELFWRWNEEGGLPYGCHLCCYEHRNLTLNVNSIVLIFHTEASREHGKICFGGSIDGEKRIRRQSSTRARTHINNGPLFL